MAKVIFVNPPLFLKERYGKLAVAGSMAPPFGLCCLAAVTRQLGYDSKIIDAAAEGVGHQTTAKMILKEDPFFVGINVTTLSVFSAAKLAGLIKKVRRDLTIVVGGPHISALPEETMRKFPVFDIGAIGEGEMTIAPLLKAIEDRSSLSQIKGIIFRKNRRLIKTEPQPLIKNLDVLPFPAWDLLPNLVSYYRPAAFNCKKFPAASLITSRGCMARCTFCSRAVFGNCWRGHSAEYVLLMVKKLYEDYGIREIKIFDDNFVVSKERVLKFCRLLRKEGMNLSWSCSARVDLVNHQILKEMRKAGCWQIFYGIESGSQKILDNLNKRIKIKDIKHTVAKTKKVGIEVVGSFMIGCPLETRETIRQTINFAKKLDIGDLQMTFFTPLPGSEIYKNASKYGTFDNDWKKMNLWYPVFIPFGLKKEELLEYQKTAFRQFYFRTKTILSYIRRIKSKEHISVLLGGLKALVKFS